MPLYHVSIESKSRPRGHQLLVDLISLALLMVIFGGLALIALTA